VKCKWCVLVYLILNNDRVQWFARFFYIKWKEGGREQDRRETERECVREAELCSKRKKTVAIKQTIRE